ncbi:cytochrome P450 [Immersiella caudata]|uniref:Cytochrome P450 n=1 Tax=Immersiella caudata TaxID=314043 RepID=A0AA40BTP1_9PEZI|nr:cytochrome P450 [Immersiella caudata]
MQPSPCPSDVTQTIIDPGLKSSPTAPTPRRRHTDARYDLRGPKTYFDQLLQLQPAPSNLTKRGIVFRVIFNLYLHPLARFSGLWYYVASSLPLAIHSNIGNASIRIAPTLLFLKPVSIKDIYANTKANLYGTGLLGPPHLFSTLNGDDYKALRRALARIDDHIRFFTSKMLNTSRQGRPVVLSDRLSQFTADVMTLLSFSEPWGNVENERDKHGIITELREVLDFLGFAMRFRFIRETILESPLAGYLLPSEEDPKGHGFLLGKTNRLVAEREKKMEEGDVSPAKPDYLQYALSARINGKPLGPAQKRAHVTLLSQAGTDTVGTAMGGILRFLVKDPARLAKAVAEIDAAVAAGNLSSPVQFEDTRSHLPFLIACIKEGLRLNPPATNLFARISRNGATRVGSAVVPEGAEMTTCTDVVFRPERWLENEERSAKMDAASFAWGGGARICLGKGIATFEMYKLLSEIIGRFEIELVDEGQYVVAGSAAYN